MKIILAVKFLLLVAAVTLSQTPASSPSLSDKSAKVDALMAPWSQNNTPGAAVIVIQDGKILHKKGYGMADLETRAAIGADTVFNIASVSKQFTAMAVMMLAERGKLSYSDPLAKFFPEFPAGQQITIRHLLNHTSGLADFTIYWKEGQRINKGSARRTADDIIKFLIQQNKLDFMPGEKWRYSNSGYVLLTAIVGKVSGVPFEQFVRENIFQPLGMNGSFVYDGSKSQIQNRAPGYIQNGGTFTKADFNPNNFIAGDGNIYCTAEDMYKWDQALDTEKLVKAATLSEAFTSGSLSDGTRFNYGFGWGLGKYFGVPFVSHSGGTDGFVAHIARFPAQRFTVVLLSNFEQLTPSYSLANKIAGIYLAGELLPSRTVEPDAKKLKDYAGTYEFFNIAMKVTFENDALWITTQKIKKAKFVPVGKDEFIVEGSDGEAIYEFKRSANGTVTGVSLLNIDGLFLSKQPK